eukprot:1966612-Rhodomonas_salina.1
MCPFASELWSQPTQGARYRLLTRLCARYAASGTETVFVTLPGRSLWDERKGFSRARSARDTGSARPHVPGLTYGALRCDLTTPSTGVQRYTMPDADMMSYTGGGFGLELDDN